MELTSPAGSSVKNKTGGWRTFIPRTDLKKCIGCGTCARVCPDSAVTMLKKKPKDQPQTNYDYCKGCGLCAAECPVQCIKMELDKK